MMHPQVLLNAMMANSNKLVTSKHAYTNAANVSNRVTVFNESTEKMLRNLSAEIENFQVSGLIGDPKAEIFMERKDGNPCGINGEMYIKFVSGAHQAEHGYPVSAVYINITPGTLMILQ